MSETFFKCLVTDKTYTSKKSSLMHSCELVNSCGESH